MVGCLFAFEGPGLQELVGDRHRLGAERPLDLAADHVPNDGRRQGCRARRIERWICENTRIRARVIDAYTDPLSPPDLGYLELSTANASEGSAQVMVSRIGVGPGARVLDKGP